MLTEIAPDDSHMISSVHVATMGTLELVGDQPMRQQQPLALLCYLAIEGPKTRRHLATVFWPNAKQPLNNLSSALTRIRGRLPQAIEADGPQISCSLTTDVGVLTHAIERLDTDTILEVYRGHFFEAADLRSMGLELEEWVFSTRDTLAKAAADALLTVAASVHTLDPRRSAELADAAYAIGHEMWTDRDQWQRCYDLLAANSKVTAERALGNAAEAGFELCERTPIEDDIEIDLRDRPTKSATDPTSTNTRLFGRHSELETVAAFVARDDDAWLSIVGMGGVGKTSLARAFVAEHDLSTTSVWVALAELAESAQITEAVALGCNLPYTDDEALLAALALTCAKAPVVLVLDNLEHLSGFEQTLTLLAAVPRLRLIVTSRVVTGLAGEVVLPLHGLTADTQTHSAALAMFMARARDAFPGIVDQPHLAHKVCELVDGLPLAIELCAGWLRAVPLDVLVDSLIASNELLESSPLHELESIDSVLERSWALLDHDDAITLNKLAIFEGSFSFAEAHAVTDCSITAIARLVDRSLIMRIGARYELHPLVRSHARAGLTRASHDATASRLVQFYSEQLAEAAIGLRGSNAGSLTAALAATMANIEAAWRHALLTDNWAAVATMVDGLDQHLKSQSRQYLASRLFEHALTTLAPHTEGPDANADACVAFVAVGWRYALARTVQGSMDDGENALADCVRVCETSDQLGHIGISYVHGHRAIFLGDYEQALVHFEDARSLIDEPTQDWLQGEIDSGIGMAAIAMGDVPRARAALRSVLDTGRKLGNPVTLSLAYYSLSSVELTEDVDLAMVLLEEGRVVAEAAGLTHMLRKIATATGHGHVKRGDHQAAITVFSQAVHDAEDEWQAIKEPWVLVCNQTGLGMAYALAGQLEQATEWFSRAVRASVELNDRPLMIETVLEICRARTDVADLDSWVSLLAQVLGDPASTWDWRLDAQALLDAAEREIPSVDLAIGGGAERSAPVRLDRIAEQALAVLRAPQPHPASG